MAHLDVMETSPRDPPPDDPTLDPDLLELQQLVIGLITGIEGRADVLKAEIVALQDQVFTLKQEIARLKVLAARPPPHQHHP